MIDRLCFAAAVMATIAATILPPQAAARDRPVRVWLDVDPGCATGRLADVDDCWAMAMLLASPRIRVVGIGTTFGNVDGVAAFRAARMFLRRWQGITGRAAPPLFRGMTVARLAPSGRRIQTAASRALARRAREGRLTIIALGPLTNVAAALDAAPSIAGRIDRIVAVMGRRRNETFLTGRLPFVHVHDINVERDPASVARVLAAPVPLTLAPFEAGQRLVLTESRLREIERQSPLGSLLARQTRAWDRLWRRWLNGRGFPAFDAAAVAALELPGLTRCERLPARLEYRRFLGRAYGADLHVGRMAETRGGARRHVRYCYRVDPEALRHLTDRLRQETASPGTL